MIKKLNIKSAIYSLLTFILMITSFNNIFVSSKALDWDPVKWLMCDVFKDSNGPDVLKILRSDYEYYLFRSKSVDVSQDSDTYNVFDSLLMASGYKFADQATSVVNPFEVYGLRGIKFASYTGEWKYYNVEPCKVDDDRQEPTSTNYGQYYESRLDPLATHSEVNGSVDNRVKEFAKGPGSALKKSAGDRIANTILWIAKFILTLTLSVISLSLSDISTLLGFGKDFQTNIVKELHTGFFQPLVVVVFVATGLYIMYYGLIKRQYREAVVGGLVKTIGSFLLAILLFAKPEFVALPNKAAVLGQSIVVAALGQNVENQPNSLCATETGLKSLSQDSDDFLDKASDGMRSIIGCRMWAEFLFKPYLLGQFNAKYEELNSLDNVNSEWVGEPKVTLGTNEITNWGLLHVSVLSGSHKSIDKTNSPLINGIHKDYYRLVDALSNYDEDVIEAEDDSSDENGSSGSSGRGQQSANALKFIEENGELAKKIADESGLYASVMLAQAAIESGWGASPSGDFNYFGIKCGSGFSCKQGLTTNEVYNGQTVTIQDGFRNFENAEDGWEGYARFIHGEGAGADFSGSFKRNASTPREAIQALKNAGYATDPTYVDKIMQVIDTYDLTRFDTDNKDGTNLDKYKSKNTNGTGASSDGGASSTGVKVDIPIPKDNPPLKEWIYWNGSNQGHRIGYALLMVVLTIVGSFAPLVFAMTSAILGIGITILSMLAPIFLLFGCWGGKGNKIFLQWVGTLFSTILKKIYASMLLMISIFLVLATMDLINKVGVFKALLVFVILVFLLIKKKDEILNKLSQVNFGQLNTSHFHKAVDKVKNGARTVRDISLGAVAGGLQAKKVGGSFKQGLKAGTSKVIKNKLYESHTGRTMMTIHETTSKKLQQEELVKFCVSCSQRLPENTTGFVDENNNYYCEACAAARSYDNMTDVYIDNVDENKINMTDNRSTYAYYNSTNSDNEESSGVEQLRHLNHSDIARMNITQDSWNTQRLELQDKITQSMAIIHSDIDNIKQLENGKIGTPFIPEPIRMYVSPTQLQELIKHNKLDEYANVMQEGWLKWYEAQHNIYNQSEDNTILETDLENIKQRIDNIKDHYSAEENNSN